MPPIHLENGETVYDISEGYCWSEVENEEDFEDNIYSVKAFIPPED